MSGVAPGAGPGLDAHVVVVHPALTVDVVLAAAPGEVLALLGPNGAGKTTTLRALSGLQPLDAGTVRLGSLVLDGPGTHLPAHARPVGVVHSDGRLFPHLSARENVAFGLRARGLGRADARAAADTWLARVGLAEHADARPGALSGGQAQRVALARALAGDPGLLLLDEPLSALDAGTRDAVRHDLAAHLADYDGVTVLVTHDVVDALVLASTVVVVEGGAVVQTGTPAELARAPRTPYVARLVGLNLFRGTAAGTTVTLDDGGTLTLAEPPAPGPVLVTLPPAAVTLHRERPHGSARNCWPATVAGVERLGGTVRVRLEGPPSCVADLTAGAVADLGLGGGTQVWAAVKAVELQARPA